MGSACLTKAKLSVLPDHFQPRTQGLAAEQEAKPWLHVSRLKQCPGAHCRNSSYSLGSRERSQESLLIAAGLNTWTGEGAIRRGATVALALL